MTFAHAASERLSIEGPAGPLETLLEDSDASSMMYAVLCHPHPLFGGTLDNKVVWTLARALRDAGIPTLRFNFRGVGKSGGTYDDGVGETLDAAAVAAFGAVRWPGRRLVLGGFSFGAYVALRLAQETDVARLILVAPPVDRFAFGVLKAPACPWLVVQGDADELVDPEAVIAWSESVEPKPRLRVLPGVGHFFHGSLSVLRDAVRDEVRSG